MSDVKWIKITTNMFDDEKIKIIESMPDKDSILIIWIKLLIQAGRTNASSYIFLSENIPYTEEMLATIFNRPLNTVRLALQTFQKLGMIKIDEKGIFITNFSKYQNLEGMEKIKGQWKVASKKYREKQKALPEAKNKDSHMTLYDGHKIDIDIEEDIDIDKDKKKRSIREKEITVQENEPNSSEIYKNILNHFNQTFSDLYNPFRLTEKKIDQLRLRLKTYTLEEIKAAITNCHSDPSCRGNNKSGWKADWDYLFRNDERIDKYLNLKGGDDNGQSRTYQKPDRRPLTAEDYDEPEYRSLVRASERKLENLPEVPPDS